MEAAVLEMNARFFRFDLSGLAMFQYALYGGPEGGHFDWHKDYGRDPNHTDQEPRKLTLSLQLSAPSDYQGCELQVRAGNQIDTAPRTRGTLIAFPANVLHQVTPIKARHAAGAGGYGRWDRSSAERRISARGPCPDKDPPDC